MVFFYDKDRDGTRFDCELCNKSYCLTCKVEFHEGVKCEDF
jgi:hypothetical protein